MDGCVDGWMDGWMDGCVHGWMHGWMDGWMNEWMDGWMDKQTDGPYHIYSAYALLFFMFACDGCDKWFHHGCIECPTKDDPQWFCNDCKWE